MSATSDLRCLFHRRRVLICIGTGGAGKTTVAAATALLAARSGLRTLCLTIDPARRLASSLGLSCFPKEELEVSSEFLRSHGVELAAPLTVMMLDAQETFDSLIHSFARSSRQADRICQHRVYRHLARNLAGTQAYMAMEKVLQVMLDDRYDLIVLDTPPSAQALAFFDAPEKMSQILASPATRALSMLLSEEATGVKALVSAGLSRAMRALERVIGTGLIAEVSELLAAMSSLLDGFDERARKVQRSLRSSEFAYLAVTTPGEVNLDGTRRLVSAMKARSLKLDAVIFNRVASPALDDATLEDISARSFGMAEELSENSRRAIVQEARREAERYTQQQVDFSRLMAELSSSVLPLFLPAFADDVHEPERLMRVADILSGGGLYFSPLPRKNKRSGTDS